MSLMIGDGPQCILISSGMKVDKSATEFEEEGKFFEEILPNIENVRGGIHL